MKYGVFVGLAGLDLIYYQPGVPAENKKSKTDHYAALAGGPAANAAVTYALLGGNAVLITCIGDSEFGRIIKNELSGHYGIDIIDCAAGEKMLPGISAISVNTINASRTIWSGRQLLEDKDAICIGRYSNEINHALSISDFCLSDCNLPEISRDVIRLANHFSRPVVLDAGSWKDGMEFYLKAAHDAIASADCIPPDDNGNFFETARNFGVKNIAVTDGEHPIRWAGQAGQGILQPPRVPVLDTLGAGDVFHGAYCYFRYAENLPFPESMQRAADVASFSVQYYGPREGVKEYIKSRM